MLEINSLNNDNTITLQISISGADPGFFIGGSNLQGEARFANFT